ncbi:MAG: helix-turn-helix transcriptional regulator [Defluviitaleaceae bacterium]|nr:helix-turn-helix transcriptional regulator [Defluviitaleaceae bacterium]
MLSKHIDEILIKIISLGEQYGYSISKTVTKVSEGDFEIKEASLYTGLRRLEKEKIILSYWGDESQGGRRKYYKLTDEGYEKLEENFQIWQKTKSIIDKIYGMEE